MTAAKQDAAAELPALPRLVSYRRAAGWIRDGDLLLFRGRGLVAALLRVAGRGVHTHAELACWSGEHLESLGFREGVGGRAVSLRSQVARCPGRIDVYRPKPELTLTAYEDGAVHQLRLPIEPARAAHWLREQLGRSYGWGNIAFTALRHVLLFRLLAPAVTDDAALTRHPPYCSQAVSMAFRLTHAAITPAGRLRPLDPAPNLPDWLTEPCDLARSLLFDYLFTLTED